MLIQMGADVHALDLDGQGPLDLAIKYERTEIERLFRESYLT